jgi:hypothetical protein
VQSAHAPLPHFARIQAAFGRHDLSDVKAQVGGPAGEANDRMRSLGYTVGDRIGFRASPDLRLAARGHARRATARRRSASDGVGRPGDGYEQQADAVADAVERGESAELLLDRAAGRILTDTGASPQDRCNGAGRDAGAAPARDRCNAVVRTARTSCPGGA